MTTYAYTMMSAAALLLCACTARMDMQGQDPNEFYAAHPIKNKVESREVSVMVHFPPEASSLPPGDMARLHQALQNIAPPAIDVVRIRIAKNDMHNQARKTYLAALLRRMGYKNGIRFESSPGLARGDADIDVTYLAIVLPDCPDWRTSPVTSYSNTWQGNFHCAQEVNLGLMVADPHDLVKGSARVSPDTDRDAKVIEDYRAGKGFDQVAPWDTSSSSGSGAGSSTPGSGSGPTTGAGASSGGP
ncbi:MAG: hypothetical protein KGI29_01080 [Pseudomonadota bacterium]|nr:hypothetical protein [Pseudomonadota bacterium]MDE3037054.1 hypothetical protein [Pseudomonadota bacterium]